MPEQSQNVCPSCGTRVQSGARFCSNCGHVLGENAPPNPPEPDSIQTESVSVPPLPNTQNTGGGGAGRVVRNIAIGCGGLLVIFVLFLLIVGLFVGGSGTGGESTSDSGSEQEQDADAGETFTNENYGELVADPDAYDGVSVDITGQLLGPPEASGGEIAFQMFADPENVEQNTIVYYPEDDVDLRSDDYVRVQGTAGGTFEGENAFGATLEAVTVDADSVNVVSAAEAVDPTLEATKVGATDVDQGLTMSLDRVEFGKRTTRAYVTIANNTRKQASFYSYGSRIVQGSSQIDVDDSYIYELDEPQSEIAPGVTTEGAIVFGPADPGQPMRFEFEWSSYNYSITPRPLTFEVTP